MGKAQFRKAPEADFPCPPRPCFTPCPVVAPAPQRDSSRGRDLVLPLDVSLEELYTGGKRRVKINRSQLARAQHDVAQDIFEVVIDKGAPDGHRVTFPGKANVDLPGLPGDVSFVLQERRHE